jgi:predicted anti-sigma-YlaC factor YlaD
MNLSTLWEASLAYMPVLYPAVLALLAFFLRLLACRRVFSLIGFIVDLISTMIVGFVTSFAADHEALSNKIRWAIVFVSALIGPEMIAGVLQIAAIFSRSPVTFILRIVRAVSGNPFSKEELEQMMDWERTLMREVNSRPRDEL